MTETAELFRRASILALLLGIVPAIVINLNYLIAASEGIVPWCVPYWEGCTSISATGREGTAFYFFKASMAPLAFIYAWYWLTVTACLRTIGYSGRGISVLGIIASLALLIYTLVLGAGGDYFQLTRRIGIIFYFTLVYLCQLLVVYRLGRGAVSDPSRHWQLALLTLVLLLGLLSLLLDAVLDHYDDYEDSFEWTLALLLHGNFLLGAWGWRNLAGSSS
ncbi:MAG: hypothetical protein RL120_01475, partial [Gammaproteobacteria bacterium]